MSSAFNRLSNIKAPQTRKDESRNAKIYHYKETFINTMLVCSFIFNTKQFSNSQGTLTGYLTIELNSEIIYLDIKSPSL